MLPQNKSSLRKYRRPVIGIAFLLLAAWWFTFGRWHSDAKYNQPGLKVSWRTASTIESILNVHGSPIEVLRVNGKVFYGAKGAPSYYLKVPDRHLIIFLRQNERREHFVHAFDYDANRDTEIDVGRWSPSGEFGDTQIPKLYVKVLKQYGEEIVLESLSGGLQEFFTINLKTKTAALGDSTIKTNP